ncbi:hypothetical protein [Aeoliella sp.]|uniref:hypothetical protein n=1 Tax=Aeoliella sp. TaxID=2795800 RepID=UPI003CCBEA81
MKPACLFHLLIPAVVVLCLPAMHAAAEDEPEFELVVEDNFEKPENHKQWQMLDPKSWQFTEVDGRSVLSQYARKSEYKPPHRSPFHVALLKEKSVGDFDMTASVRSTVEDYGHRDACLIFGFVDAAHFYYVHIGKKTDPHCNQIFLVNGADRKAISLTTTEGTNWSDDWHRVKITRRTDTGRIEVFFDNFEKPIMTAEDKTLPAGRVGVGSFDDCADWDDFELRGTPAKLPEEKAADAKDE